MDLQMLGQAAAVLVRLSAMLAFQLASGRLLFLRQRCAVAGSSLRFCLVVGRE